MVLLSQVTEQLVFAFKAQKDVIAPQYRTINYALECN